MTISPFTPLHFPEDNVSDGLASRTIQLFSTDDRIMVQVSVPTGGEAPDGSIINAVTESSVADIEWQEWSMTGKTMYFAVLIGMTPGLYRIGIDDEVSDVFRVTDDAALLESTTLIQYRFEDNRSRDDVVSVIDGVPFFFDFRVPGGFKDSGWQFGVDNEQFATQRQDLIELYAWDYTNKTFTMGGPLGVPVWFAELLNRLLTCDYVYFNGERYVRTDSEVPQMNVLVDGLDSFVFTQLLRKTQVRDAAIEDLNMTVIRRVEDANDDLNRITDDEQVRTLSE